MPAPAVPPRQRSPPAGADARQLPSSSRPGSIAKLLNRLKLEALAQADRPRAESEIRTLATDC